MNDSVIVKVVLEFDDIERTITGEVFPIVGKTFQDPEERTPPEIISVEPLMVREFTEEELESIEYSLCEEAEKWKHVKE